MKHHDCVRTMRLALQRLSVGAQRGMGRSDKRAKEGNAKSDPRESNGWYTRDRRENERVHWARSRSWEAFSGAHTHGLRMTT